MRGIQYAVTSIAKATLVITGSPAFAGDDTFCAAARPGMTLYRVS
jgi:hypothetical protein